MKDGLLHPLLKRAAVSPLPKQRPPASVEEDIRPIALTCQLAKILEGFTLTRILPKILQKLDLNQFAVAGKSTTDALVYLLHWLLDGLDRGNCSGLFFFADFKKGFDLIDHKILLSKLRSFDLHPCLVRWITTFLEGRTQFVRISSASSSILPVNGGIPQGTRLGPVLFAVMVNDLMSSWPPRAKFVDDLTLLEIVPRNSPPVMNFLVEDIHQYANSHNMRLNPKKCKTMAVDFLEYNSCVWSPIVIGNTVVERASEFKLLGIVISHDLTWDAHCAVILKKANKRLYALRQLKKVVCLRKI